MTLIPLLTSDAGEPDYLILEEALAQGKVEITEVTEGGRVPELKIINNSATFGPGNDVRGEGQFVSWAALVLDGQILHLSAFCRNGPKNDRAKVRFQRFSQRERKG